LYRLERQKLSLVPEVERSCSGVVVGKREGVVEFYFVRWRGEELLLCCGGEKLSCCLCDRGKDNSSCREAEGNRGIVVGVVVEKKVVGVGDVVWNRRVVVSAVCGKRVVGAVVGKRGLNVVSVVGWRGGG